MSVREQERRARETEKRMNREMREADRRIRGRILAQQKQADIRAKEVVRRIEKGDVEPRELPGKREDSMESMESMESMKSSRSMPSAPSAPTVIDVGAETETDDAGENMPLEDVMPYDAEGAGEDLAQRTTEETGSGGDPHAHNEARASEMAQQMTDDTGAGDDMNLHAERKVDQMGNEMFEE